MTSKTPRIRGRKLDLYTRTPNGISQRPQKIWATTNPSKCSLRNSIASASSCRLSNTDKKSPPCMSFSAAISFRTFTSEIGIETSIKVTISEACVLLTPLSKRYSALTTKIKPMNPISSLTMPRRKIDSEAVILMAVAVASPDTMKCEGTYRRLKKPGMDVNRYRNPATLAALLVEFMLTPYFATGETGLLTQWNDCWRSTARIRLPNQRRISQKIINRNGRIVRNIYTRALNKAVGRCRASPIEESKRS